MTCRVRCLPTSSLRSKKSYKNNSLHSSYSGCSVAELLVRPLEAGPSLILCSALQAHENEGAFSCWALHNATKPFYSGSCTDKKENQIFLIFKEIQSGAFAKSYMRKGFLIYEEMRKYFPIYEDEEAVSHIWLCNCSILNFLIYEDNLIFFFISVGLCFKSWKTVQFPFCFRYFFNQVRLSLQLHKEFIKGVQAWGCGLTFEYPSQEIVTRDEYFNFSSDDVI